MVSSNICLFDLILCVPVNNFHMFFVIFTGFFLLTSCILDFQGLIHIFKDDFTKFQDKRYFFFKFQEFSRTKVKFKDFSRSMRTL